MTLAQDLSLNTLGTIRDQFALVEVNGPDGGPLLSLTSAADPGQNVGEARVFEGTGVERMVYVRMTVEQLGLDSHMLFAFAPATSALPHFTLDAVKAGDNYAFHLDLVPRTDVAVHLPYLQAVFVPLTEIREAVLKWEGVTPAHLSPLQWSMLSQWMLAQRTTEQAFGRLPEPVGQYLDHWLGLMTKGLPEEATAGLEPTALAERDRQHRKLLFSAEVDPVWVRVQKMVGPQACQRIQELLIGQ